MHRVVNLSLVAGMMLAAILGGLGCQSTGSGTHRPEPNFTGPRVVGNQPGQTRQTYASPGAVRTLPPTQTMPPRAMARQTGPADWVPAVRTDAGQWRWIIIHHTATPSGALARINASHKNKGWDECGYHFVVGNGTESMDGQIEVGPRWPKQKHGAHTRSSDNRFNEHGIGVVMVGNFDMSRPSQRQLDSTAKLVAYLMKTYNVPASRVLGHRNAAATDCPGKYTSLTQIKQQAIAILAASGDRIPEEPARAAMGPDAELLHDAQ
jgi:hypothetical protein